MLYQALGAAFFISLLGLWLFRRGAPALGLVDRPEARSEHVVPVPVGGGGRRHCCAHPQFFIFSRAGEK